MTDHRNDNGARPEAFDDDRLLACALGLEEDAELLEAAASDAELAARLEAMRADVATIGSRLSAAVPPPQEGYADLSDERWSGLAEFLASKSEAQRRRRWWRVAVPVAALAALAVVVGLAAVNNGGLGGSGSSSSQVAQSDGDGGAPAGTQNLEGGVGTEGKRAATSEKSATEQFADQLDRFAVVVLARAREATGAVQRFAVLRIFKGDAPKVVELVVNDRPADEGRLHLLLLDPTSESGSASPVPTPESPTSQGFSSTQAASPSPSGASPWPTESPQATPSLADDDLGEPLAVSYTYHGEPTVIRELAAGTSPDSVDVPIQ